MSVIRLNVPPDHTPEEEAQLVAEVAASYAESTGSDDVTVEVTRSEEVDHRALGAHASSRWAG
jgi:phenylpyruvate tautomerase PptA (4-oxalocrotonate tautomerase family)